MNEYCVAVKYANEPTRLIGEFTRKEAENHAGWLRQSWANNRWPDHLKPTSIRIRALNLDTDRCVV